MFMQYTEKRAQKLPSDDHNFETSGRPVPDLPETS
jgi:hypothetical protein